MPISIQPQWYSQLSRFAQQRARNISHLILPASEPKGQQYINNRPRCFFFLPVRSRASAGVIVCKRKKKTARLDISKIPAIFFIFSSLILIQLEKKKQIFSPSALRRNPKKFISAMASAGFAH